MEIVRRDPADQAAMDDFRVRQLRARDMLRGDLEGAELEQHVQDSVLTTTLDKAVNWARGNAMFPATFGLVEFLAFIAILLVAYVYIWRKGALEWH